MSGEDDCFLEARGAAAGGGSVSGDLLSNTNCSMSFTKREKKTMRRRAEERGVEEDQEGAARLTDTAGIDDLTAATERAPMSRSNRLGAPRVRLNGGKGRGVRGE